MKKILTIMLNGIGIHDGNVIQKDMPFLNNVWQKYPHSELSLPANVTMELSNYKDVCEKVYATLGAGRYLKNNIDVINEFFDRHQDNDNLKRFLDDNHKRIHLVFPISSDSISLNLTHFLKFYQILCECKAENILVHLILRKGIAKEELISCFDRLTLELTHRNKGKLCSLIGEKYALDTTEHFDRTRAYYEMLADGRGLNVLDIKKMFGSFYERKVDLSELKPIVINKEPVLEEDIIIWFNYTSNEFKQICEAFDGDFSRFTTNKYKELTMYSMLPINDQIKSILDIDKPQKTFGKYLAELEVTQARIGDSFIMNAFDGTNKLSNCDRYNVLPSRIENIYAPITKKIMDVIDKDIEFIIVNYSCYDSNYEKELDYYLKAIVNNAEENFYKIIIIGGVSNNNESHEKDLINVPFIIIDSKAKLKAKGNITSWACTTLDYMDISIPEEMKQEVLLID